MPVGSAEIIDLQGYRDARRAESAAAATVSGQFLPTVMMPMAWVPVWFVPVRFVGTSMTAG